jgi:hypothetical protein
MSKIIRFSLFFLVLSQAACTVSQSLSDDYNYSENLAKYRPIYKDTLLFDPSVATKTKKNIEPALELSDQNQEIGAWLARVADGNRKIKYVMGYRLQVYSGSDRVKANQIISELRRHTQAKIDLEYSEPSFQVKVGGYFTRLEAHRTYAEIKKAFPDAVIINDKVSFY